jgi:hypothetical protein
MPERLHNMEAGPVYMQLNNMQEQQPREVTCHTGPTEDDDFLLHMVAGDMTCREDNVDVTGVSCCSWEEADDLAHVAVYNNQLNSLATSKYRQERSGEMRNTAPARDTSRDICNKCGKIGHWARNCPSQTAPGARQNYLQPQQAKRRPSNFRQPQRNYGSSSLSGHRFRDRPGGIQADPARRYSFWRGGGSASAAKGNTHLTEIPITGDTLRAAHNKSESIYLFDMFDGTDTPHSLEDDRLFMLA